VTFGDDPLETFRKAERRLHAILFGDGTYEPGLVKGAERRAEVTRQLRRIREAFDALREAEARRAERSDARIAELEDELREIAEELRAIAASQSEDRAQARRRKAS
jgi:hypothetical protein